MNFLDVKNKNKSQNGFTLVELTIVIIIVSFMAATATSVFLNYQEKTKVFFTKERLKTIQASIHKFFSVNGRYPCPAPFTLRFEDAGFGIEVNSHPSPLGRGCLIGPYPNIPGIPGGAEVNDLSTSRALSIRRFANPPLYPTPRFNGDIRIGAIPARTLNLPDDYALDAWGATLTYAVMVHQATSAEYMAFGFTHDKGGIRIEDSSGNSLTNPEDTAHYIVLSHGSDQKGARSIQSNQLNGVVNPCDAAERQGENCDNDATFVLTTSFSDLGGTVNAFDDIGVFEVQRRKDHVLPPGTVLPFDTSQCPQGWSEYTTTKGRFLIGIDPNGAGSPAQRLNTVQPTGTSFLRGGNNPTFAPPSNDQAEYIIGDMSEDGIENIPAYLALRYCAKN